MGLKEREAQFESLTSRFEHKKITPLIASHKIETGLFEKLRAAAQNYVIACLPDSTKLTRDMVTDEARLLTEFSRQQPNLKNMTPNGILVPKKQYNLEYNLFLKAFGAVMASLGIFDFVEHWVGPANLRFKDGVLKRELLNRNYPSEYKHTEAWIMYHTPHSIDVFMPLLGDCENNYVEFFQPPQDKFQESWLEHQPSYKAGSHIAEFYNKVEVEYKAGSLVIADVACMHSTIRKADSKPRVSIDTSFRVKSPDAPRGPLDFNDKPTPEVLDKIGIGYMYLFKDELGGYIETEGKPMHSTHNKRLLELTN
jgi:hypothetical protein